MLSLKQHEDDIGTAPPSTLMHGCGPKRGSVQPTQSNSRPFLDVRPRQRALPTCDVRSTRCNATLNPDHGRSSKVGTN